MFLKTVLISLCLCIQFTSQVKGSYIRFYRNSNYTNTYYESNVHKGCNVIPDPYSFTSIGSVETDTCVILYHGSFGVNCKTIESQKVLAGNSTTIWPHTTGFHECDETVGGVQLNIDIVKPQKWFGGYLLKHYELLSTHQDVCSCVNIPESINQTELWSIYNNHNDYIAYFERDCEQVEMEAQFVSSRKSWFSTTVPFIRDEILYTPNTIKSFGPDKNSTYFKYSCNVKQNVKILQDKNVELQKMLEDSVKNLTERNEKQEEEMGKLVEKYNEMKITLEHYRNGMEDKLENLRDDISEHFD